VVAALEGVIDDDDVARLPGGEVVENGLDAGRHGAQMRRDVGGLGNHASDAVKEGARKVKPLLDIGRIAGALEGDAHLFGHAGKAVAVEL
jgi:hypothetical protein